MTVGGPFAAAHKHCCSFAFPPFCSLAYLFQMTFEKLTDGVGFRLTTDTGDSSEYRFRKNFSPWQVKHMGLYLEKLLKSCSAMGSTIATTVLVGVQSSSKTSFMPLMQGLGSLSSKSLGDGAITGLGEIVGFLGKDNNLERLAAILFLKPNERKLSADEYENRILFFQDEIEISIIWEAASSFFGSRLGSLKTMLSPLKIFESLTNEPATPTSESSTTTSDSSIDSSTPSPKDIPSGKPTS